MKLTSGSRRWIVFGVIFAREPISQRSHARRLRARMNIIGREFADRLLLLDVREAKLLSSGERFCQTGGK